MSYIYDIEAPKKATNLTINSDLLKKSKEINSNIPTKSGLMVGFGETMEEIKQTLRDLRENDVNFLTVGQYLAPSPKHAKVAKYYFDEEFEEIERYAYEIGFKAARCGKLVRSSYKAHEMVKQKAINTILQNKLLMKYKTFEEAIELANDSVYALGATIWSEDSRKLYKAAKEFNAGIVWLNTNVMSKIEASYGGNKMSGIGREGGTVGLMEYLRCKNNVLYVGPENNYYNFKE